MDAVAGALPADRVRLLTVDLEREEILDEVKGGEGADRIQKIRFEELATGTSGRVLRERKPALSRKSHSNERETPENWERRRDSGCGSTMIAPLLLHGQVIGTLTAINRPDQRDFEPRDLEFLSAMAVQAAVAVENARLLVSEQKQRKEAETLREVARILNTSLQGEEVLELILDQLNRVIPYDSASIMLVSDQGMLSIAAFRKFRTRDQFFTPLQIKALGHIQEVVETGKPVIIPDTLEDRRWRLLEHSNYIRCWLGVPLIGRAGVLGLLNLDRCEPHSYAQSDAQTALAFADQAATAIENARLYEAARRQAQEAEALRATIADLSSELELSKLLSAILVRAISLLNATGGDLGLFQENRQEILIVSSINMGKDYTGTRMKMGEGLMGKVAEQRLSMLVRDYNSWEGKSPQYKTGPWHGAIAAPMLIGRRLVGTIGIVDEDPNRDFTASDQRLLELFGQQAAIAVENASLYQSARQSAERRSILHQVSRAMVSVNFEPESIYEAAHVAASQLMASEAFIIALVDESEDSIDTVYLAEQNERFDLPRTSLQEGLCGHVVSSGEPVYVRDIQAPEFQDFRCLISAGNDRIRSLLAVPMRLGGKVIGMLSTQSYEPDSYSQDDLYLLEMLASYTAIALENARLFQEVQLLAITDPLTDLFNRRHLLELGEREFKRARRFDRPLAVLMVDIDEFKQVNDTHGHLIGDQVLVQLSRKLLKLLREIDILGRYGGEEFTIILPETGIHEAYSVAERLRSFVADTPMPSEAGGVSITLSIGVTELQHDTQSLEELIRRADVAAYAAKYGGRNRTIIR